MQAKLRVVWRPGLGDPVDVASRWAAALEDGERVPAAGVSAVRPADVYGQRGKAHHDEQTATLLVLVQGATTPKEGLALASRRAARVLGDDPRVSEIRAVAAWPVP